MIAQIITSITNSWETIFASVTGVVTVVSAWFNLKHKVKTIETSLEAIETSLEDNEKDDEKRHNKLISKIKDANDRREKADEKAEEKREKADDAFRDQLQKVTTDVEVLKHKRND